jgi:hypothetical protein
MEYEILEADEISPERLILRNEDDSISFIPLDEANTDYQAYLEWLEEKN